MQRRQQQRIEAKVLIPGSGDPIPDGVVILEGTKIAYAGPSAEAPPPPAGADSSFVTYTVPAVMPGMWDVHSHFIGRADSHPRNADLLEEIFSTPVGTRTARAVGHVAKVLDAGFTSCREVGGDGEFIAPLIDAGDVRGPKIYYAGHILSQTGGHGDHHDKTLECMAVCPHSKVGHLCDGVPECLKAVRSQLRRGASVIKICTSGGVMSEVDHPCHQEFSDEEIRAMVDEAARHDVVVAAHAHGREGILAALRCGCHTIEHASFWDDECTVLAERRTRGRGHGLVVVVPTCWIIEYLRNMTRGKSIGDEPPPGLTQASMDKLIAFSETHRGAIRKVLKAAGEGRVKVATGCDLFIGIEYGYNGRELVYLVEHGFTPAQAIEAATANGPSSLGSKFLQLRNLKSGQLRVGYDADVIALASNPLDDIRVVANPKNVTHVWKGGKLEKGEPAPGALAEDYKELWHGGKAGRSHARWDQA